MKKSTLNFYLTLFVLGLCFHLSSSFAAKHEFDDKETFTQSFISTSSLDEAPGYQSTDFEAVQIPQTSIVDTPTEAANVIVLIARVLIAISGAIFGIKNIFKKNNNEPNI